MAAVWMRFRAELRGRWLAWLGIALLVGVAGGAVIAASAGARRTDTAYDRFLARAQFPDALVGIPLECPPRDERRAEPGAVPLRCADAAEIAELPGVEIAAPAVTFGPGEVEVRTTDGSALQPDPSDPEYTGPGEVSIIAGLDDRVGTELDRLKILEGRAPDPDQVEEVALPVEVARRLDLHPGDRLQAAFARGGAQEFEIVGIEVAPFEVAPPSGQWEAFIHATPAFAAEKIEGGDVDGIVVAVRLERGEAGVDAFSDEMKQHKFIGGVESLPTSIHADVERGIRPYTIALWAGAALTALGAIAVLGQALARQMFLDSADNPALRALGLGRRQLFALGLLRAAAIGAAGSVVAVGLAIVISPLTPIGTIARTVEVDPGVAAAPAALVLGALLTMALVVAVAALPAWRLARVRGTERVSQRRPPAAVGALRRSSLPPTAAIGVGMAFEPGRGRTAVPVRSTFVGITLALLAVTAAVTFSVSLGHLTATPRLAGWNWDVASFLPRNAADQKAMLAALADNPDVDGVAAGTFFRPFPTPDHALELGPDRVPVDIIAFDPGTVGPTVIEGRAPAAADEILLGPHTLDDIDLEIGDRVSAVGRVGKWARPETFEEVSGQFEIVGTGVVPLTGGEARLGRGATLTLAGVQTLNPKAEVAAAYIRFRPGADPGQVIREASESIGRPVGPTNLEFVGYDLVQSADLLNLEQIDRLPLLLAFLLAVMGVGSLVHVMVSAVRTRRRDLAVLRTLGFVGRQVGATIVWQATALVVLASVVAIPLGVVLGRAIWRVFAERLGVLPEPVTPWWGLLLVIAVTALVANLAAAGPAWFAARTRPALVLRSE